MTVALFDASERGALGFLLKQAVAIHQRLHVNSDNFSFYQCVINLVIFIAAGSIGY